MKTFISKAIMLGVFIITVCFFLGLGCGVDRSAVLEEGRKSGFEEGKKAGFEEGEKVGYKKGKEEGKKIGYQEGYNKGKSNGEISGKLLGRMEGLGYQRPALFATNTSMFDKIMPTLYYANNTDNTFNNVKIILNYGSSGGYIYNLGDLEVGGYGYIGIGHFFNKDGSEFPDGNAVVDCTMILYDENGNKEKIEGLVFKPH